MFTGNLATYRSSVSRKKYALPRCAAALVALFKRRSGDLLNRHATLLLKIASGPCHLSFELRTGRRRTSSSSADTAGTLWHSTCPPRILPRILLSLPYPSLPMDEWQCTTCDLVLHIKNKTGHINGKRHRRRLIAPTSSSTEFLWMCIDCVVAIPINDKDSHIATHSGAAQTTKSWRCDVCSLTIAGNNRDSHLAGAKHRAAVATHPVIAQATSSNRWTCDVCGLTMEVNNRDSHLAGVKHRAAVATATNSTPWKCDVCGLALDVNNKDSHLSGAQHREVLALPPGWWECETCDRAPMQVQNKDAHLRSQKHRTSTGVKTKRWYICTVCVKAVPQDQMEVHDASHAQGQSGGGGGDEYGGSSSDYEDDADLEDVGLSLLRNVDLKRGKTRRGGYAMCAKAVLRDQMRGHDESRAMGRRGEKSRRRPGGDDGGGSSKGACSSSDGDGGSSDSGHQGYYDGDDDLEEEGLSILRDIDTPWGMASNFYYGPRLRDYY
ncbi:hypothetical protein CPB85DRAFT_894062 [Mucidula mucida]|nr:hypothetical protein CPB85DRAFT_894062 [Mucidula mucida]